MTFIYTIACNNISNISFSPVVLCNAQLLHWIPIIDNMGITFHCCLVTHYFFFLELINKKKYTYHGNIQERKGKSFILYMYLFRRLNLEFGRKNE
ncbi:hypothetical protein BDC45DRAFT_496740 [Circinella umbellata]|nr:hypothetical protein BDC45DRAFT_496740 [Circinella umbellata]